jgi:UDP-galactopyranose mutase
LICDQPTDVLIIGAGFSGLVMAERLANVYGLRSVVVDRRDHIGGNAFDFIDEHGVLVHRYGPHYFRTNSRRVVSYLSEFTGWTPADYRILSYAEGKFWSFPINLLTFEQWLGRPSTEEEFGLWLEAERIPFPSPKNSEEVVLSQVGRPFYELFFRGYTTKQWKREPSELSASVCGRIPIRTSRDDRYLTESFQALPSQGYSAMFSRIREACGDRVKFCLGVDASEAIEAVPHRHLVYSGQIDEYFDHRFGELPYRSLEFQFRHYTASALDARGAVGSPGFFQPSLQVNYPGSEPFTRTVELKHVTGQTIEGTTVVTEYPADYSEGMEPFYPVPTDASARLYRRYRQLADSVDGVTFVGRLGRYKYYNMDQVVAMALKSARDVASGVL